MACDSNACQCKQRSFTGDIIAHGVFVIGVLAVDGTRHGHNGISAGAAGAQHHSRIDDDTRETTMWRTWAESLYVLSRISPPVTIYVSFPTVASCFQSRAQGSISHSGDWYSTIDGMEAPPSDRVTIYFSSLNFVEKQNPALWKEHV